VLSTPNQLATGGLDLSDCAIEVGLAH
jgi:hypothetical protein